MEVDPMESPNLQHVVESINSDVEDVYGLNFERKMRMMGVVKCDVCNERYLGIGGEKNIHRHVKFCENYGFGNDMDPGVVPVQLLNLTIVEQSLIAMIHPVLSVFKVKGCQYGYRGNVINFLQDVRGFASKLPHRIEDLSCILTVKYTNFKDVTSEFQVRAVKVRDALVWLQRNNQYYAGIEISEENMSELPVDGNVFDRLQSMTIDGEDDVENDVGHVTEGVENGSEESTVGIVASSCVSLIPLDGQDQLIASTLTWPEMSEDPVNEFELGFVVRAYPCLFPYGNCDLYASRPRKIQKHEYFKHLFRYGDERFVKHPTFRFFAFNMWQRHSVLAAGRVFAKVDSNLHNMNVEELRGLLEKNSQIRKKLMFMGAKIKGSKSFWASRCGELRDMVEQLDLPTVFLTLSAADYYWPDLFRILVDKDMDAISMTERKKLIQENPAVVDMFFFKRLEIYIDEVSCCISIFSVCVLVCEL